MLLSRKWLNHYVQIDDLCSKSLADTLTQLGIEVEGIDEKPALDPKIVVGKILTAEKHPNADTLQLCEVQVSDNIEENLSIVCGAPNARPGISVVVACVGSKLPDGFKIKKAKVRSVPSFGMMCSEKELEISDENEGIIELSGNVKPGQAAAKIYDTSDSIFDLSITPNRADCLSYVGIARDLSAKLGRELKFPQTDYQGNKEKTENSFKVNVEEKDDCKRFVALHVKDYQHTSSPAWVLQALEKNGMRPVNLMVDLTNYVMLEMGQPIHAYDKASLEGNQLAVKVAEQESKFKTLDDKTVTVEKGDLLITDAKKIVGLAGVMGGLNSEVTENTKEVIIEVAHFNPAKVRKTSKRLALHTDASHRFERGIDCENISNVIKRVAHLLQQCLAEKGLKPCSIASEAIDCYPSPVKAHELELRTARVMKHMNIPPVSTDECVNMLESLGLKCVRKNEDSAKFAIPAWRHDLNREVDLIEEVARLVGFEKIPSEIPSMNITPGTENPFVGFQDDCKFAFAALGFSEVITYPFSSRKEYEELLCSEDNRLWPHVKLQNALNEQESYLQTTLVPSLLKATAQNRNYGNKAVQLFEVGRGYFDLSEMSESNEEFMNNLKTRRNHLESNKEKTLMERTYLSGIIDSPSKEKSWRNSESSPSFYEAKALLEQFFAGINLKDYQWVRPAAHEATFLHPGASAKIMHGKTMIGYAGELHPKVASNYELGADIPVLFELDLENCLAVSETKVTVAAQLKKFPPVSRDLAFMVKEEVSYADFYAAVQKNPRKKYLEKVTLFDVYQGEKMQEGYKSFASEFVFQAKDKTLSEKDINKEIDALAKHLEASVEASQR